MSDIDYIDNAEYFYIENNKDTAKYDHLLCVKLDFFRNQLGVVQILIKFQDHLK